MPELPEIYHLADQMNEELAGATIGSVEVRQEKCLNMPGEQFGALLAGRRIESVTSRGKWVVATLSGGATLLISLGMGGDALLHDRGAALPEKYQVRLGLEDGRELTLGFWWFGYVHAATDAGLPLHSMTARLGLTPIRDAGFTEEHFLGLLEGKRGAVKSFILDQSKIAGIGNVYAQDALFRARIHPGRKIESLSGTERSALYRGIMDTLSEATQLGGLAFEKDLHGQGGGFERFLVGYREGQGCPECGTAIQKIKTGSTSSYLCPTCQI